MIEKRLKKEAIPKPLTFAKAQLYLKVGFLRFYGGTGCVII
jgi:hypothetical protein